MGGLFLLFFVFADIFLYICIVMANHGYCENCWWWKMHRIATIPWAKGDCYMQNDNNGNNYKETRSIDYCPDYTNRKQYEKKNGTLENWIETDN